MGTSFSVVWMNAYDRPLPWMVDWAGGSEGGGSWDAQRSNGVDAGSNGA